MNPNYNQQQPFYYQQQPFNQQPFSQQQQYQPSFQPIYGTQQNMYPNVPQQSQMYPQYSSQQYSQFTQQPYLQPNVPSQSFSSQYDQQPFQQQPFQQQPFSQSSMNPYYSQQSMQMSSQYPLKYPQISFLKVHATDPYSTQVTEQQGVTFVQYTGTQKMVGVVQANQTLPVLDFNIGYFEVTILNGGFGSAIGIGLAFKGLKNRQPGWDHATCGYHGDDGIFYCGGKAQKSLGAKFSTGDVIGMGINYSTDTIFFTRNGQVLGMPSGFSAKQLPNSCIPTVGMSSQGASVKINFGYEKFVFDLKNAIRLLSEIHPHKLNLFRDMRKFPAYQQAGGNWRCDKCKRAGRVGMECYHCLVCGTFDLCSACVGNPTVTSSHHHPVTYEPNPAMVYPHTSGNWKCDICHQNGAGKKMYHCHTCTNFDVCENCVQFKV